MKFRILAGVVLLSSWLGLGASPGAAEPATDPIVPLDAWQAPPREFRPLARWWWPGGSVDAAVADDHLGRIAAAGFGGVELQPLLLGIGEDDLAADPQLRTVGTPEFQQRVAKAAASARKHGLDFDLTLGSGWPGGLPTDRANAERQLLMATVDVSGPGRIERELPPPPDQSYRGSVEWVLDVLGPPDDRTDLLKVLAGRLGPARDGIPTLDDVRDISEHVSGRKLRWTAPEGDWRIFVFDTNSTLHFVMGGAFPGAEADALVVDHLSVRGADALLEGYGTPVVEAAGPGAIRGVFVDSFELMGELPFTDGFAGAFRETKGYDLTPHWPLLFRRGGESKYAEMMDLFRRNGGPLYLAPEPGKAERIREDYEDVRARLFQERFMGRFVEWSVARGLELRLQAHGGYGDYLDTYALADVPEAEALFGDGSFDFLKLASSAAHVAGRRWAASESFITLRLYGTRLSAVEMDLLAGRAFSAGINRIVYHGVPYPYRRADGVVWYPFSGGFSRILAGPLPMSSHVDEAFLAELPDFNRGLARLSLAMSLGAPDVDVAWLRADPIYPDTASLQLGAVDPHAGESETTAVLRARGLVHDRVSRRMLAAARVEEGRLRVGARSYGALLLDPLAVAEPALATRLAEIAAAGVPIVALGELPTRAPGWHDAVARDAQVRAAVAELAPLVHHAAEPAGLESLLAKHASAGVVGPMEGERLSVSLARRCTEAGDVVGVFNESWSPTTALLRLARAGRALTLWDPRSGSRTVLQPEVARGDLVSVEVGPAQTLLLTLERSPGGAAASSCGASSPTAPRRAG